MHRIILKRFIIITLFFFAGCLLNNTSAFAHEGHAGPTKVFMEEKEALKAMLPAGDKIVKRKELLKKGQYKDAVKRWGYSPDEGVYSYFLSKDKAGNFSGALFIREIEYKHGSIKLIVAYNKAGEVTDIKVMSSPEKYLKDIEENIQSSGLFESFIHLKTDEIISKGKGFEKEPKGTLKYMTVKEIEGTAILLNLFHVK